MEKIMADPRPMRQLSAADRSIFDMMEKKMSRVRFCEDEVLDELSTDAWLQMLIQNARSLGKILKIGR